MVLKSLKMGRIQTDSMFPAQTDSLGSFLDLSAKPFPICIYLLRVND